MKNRVFRVFRVLGDKKGGYFEGFPLIEGGFLGKIGVLDGEMREKGGLMSGAAARTGSF